MLGPVILAASRSDKMRRFISAAPGTKQVVDRFIAGESVDQVVPVIQDAAAKGLEVTLDVVGEDITTPEQAAAARDAYLELIGRLKELGLGARAEMSVKLSMFGQSLPSPTTALNGEPSGPAPNSRAATSSPWPTSAPSSRPPPRSAPRSRWTPRTTPPSTRCSRSTRSCGRTSRRPAA